MLLAPAPTPCRILTSHLGRYTPQTWALMFVQSERLEYDFDTFDTDLQATCEGCKEDMSWEDVQKFFDENL